MFEWCHKNLATEEGAAGEKPRECDGHMGQFGVEHGRSVVPRRPGGRTVSWLFQQQLSPDDLAERPQLDGRDITSHQSSMVDSALTECSVEGSR
jgi:hypothetical protein